MNDDRLCKTVHASVLLGGQDPQFDKLPPLLRRRCRLAYWQARAETLERWGHADAAAARRRLRTIEEETL